MKGLIFCILAICLLSLSSWAIAKDSQDHGAKVVIFEKGRMPPVTFPHHLHQKTLDNDCSACHDLFPMKAGIVKEMITQKKLKNQQVMNSKCLKCHKDRKSAGLEAGPTKCTHCHVRPK